MTRPTTAQDHADHDRDLRRHDPRPSDRWREENMISLPIEYLHECFHCDAERGILTWKNRPLSHFPDLRSHSSTNARFAGQRAGSRSPTGYLDVYVDGRKVRVHRIVWAMQTGAWPTGFMDHRNRDRSDNSISNLREATKSQNGANMDVSASNKVGLKGVCPHGKRFRAQIKTRDGVKYLGMFDTPELAHAAYAAAAIEHHGEFAGGIATGEDKP